MRNKKISSLHPVKIVYNNLYKRFTNFQIDKFIKLESFLVHFPLSTFVHYTIRATLRVCMHMCAHRLHQRANTGAARDREMV